MTKLRYILAELKLRGYLTTKEQFTIEDAVQAMVDAENKNNFISCAKSLVDKELSQEDFEKLKEFSIKLSASYYTPYPDNFVDPTKNEYTKTSI